MGLTKICSFRPCTDRKLSSAIIFFFLAIWLFGYRNILAWEVAVGFSIIFLTLTPWVIFFRDLELVCRQHGQSL